MASAANDSEALVPLTMLAGSIRALSNHIPHAVEKPGVGERWSALTRIMFQLESIADQLDAHAGTKVSGH